MKYWIELTHNVLVSISFVLCGSVSCLILSYLNSVALNKECLLLYLYKDFIGAIFWNRTFWMIEVITSSFYDIGLNDFWSIFISFGVWGGTLYIALIVNIIFLLKLHMAKHELIDLQIPWMGEDDVSGMTRIRIACVVTTVGTLSTMASLGIYPDFYYLLSKDFENLPEFSVYKGIQALLAAMAMMMKLLEKIVRIKKEVTIDARIDRTTRLVIFGVFICIAMLTFGEMLSPFDYRTHWKLYPICFSIVLTIIAFVIVLRSNQLRAYSVRFVKNRCDDAFLLSIYITPTSIFIIMYGILYIL